MATNDIFAFLKRETDELAQEYERIRARTKDDPGTAGDQGEENWAQLLRRWLPAYYHVVTKGRILGADGSTSPQIDVFVLSPAYPKTLLDKKLYLAGGVVAAFECKTTLRSEHLREFFTDCAKVRQLTPSLKGTPARELKPAIIFGLLAHSHDWKKEASTPGENVEKALIDLDAEVVTKPIDMPDLVCVADLGFWHAGKFFLPIPAALGRYSMTENVVGIALETGYMAQAHATENQSATFTPIGSLLTKLFEWFAWNDQLMRGLENYLKISNVGGSGKATTRRWPMDVLSAELRMALARRPLPNGGPFSDWSMGFI